MIQGLITLGLMMMFLVFCLWVYRPSAKEKYLRASQLPFENIDTANGEQKP